MKKVLLYLSMLVFALSFTACSSDDDDDSTGGDNRVTGIWANVQSNGLVEGYYVVSKSTIEYYEFPTINSYHGMAIADDIPLGYYQDGYILCTGNGTKNGAFNYKLKGNELWVGDVMLSTVTFVDDDTVYLEGLDSDDDADEATYKRIKGLKIDKDFFGDLID